MMDFGKCSGLDGCRCCLRTWCALQTVGKLASRIALCLMGKVRANYRPSVDHADTVVVINSYAVQFSGKKWDYKTYKHYSGYQGGLKQTPAKELHKRKPIEVLRKAVFGMLPSNRTRDARMERLKIYPGPVHPHTAQFVGATGPVAAPAGPPQLHPAMTTPRAPVTPSSA